MRALDTLHYLPKQYVGVLLFHSDIERNEVEELFAYFTGDILQLPPVRSAVKREVRVRKVHLLEVLEVQGRRVLFRTQCQAGTYIRTLCTDIGRARCSGAQMEELRRTVSGPFDERSAVTLQALEDALFYWKEGKREQLLSMLHPVEELLLSFPRIVVKDSAVDSICHGADLKVRGIASIQGRIRRGDVVALMTARGEGVAIASALMSSEQMKNSASGVASDTLRVFMKTGAYPRYVKSGH